jgi:hypothetical protein
LFSPIGDRDRVIREEADAVKWFTQLVGKLKSIGGSKQAKDTTATTATAPAEPVEEAKDTAATTTEPAEKADAADAAQEKTETEASADTETVEVTEEATAEPVAEKKSEETGSADAEPEPVVAADEPAAAAEPTPAAQADEAGEAETVAVSEEAAAEVVAEAEAAAKATPKPADPALSTLDEGAITAELQAAGGPYGPGSAKPAADGAAPSAEFAVKGKESSKLFHTEKSPYFGRTKADVWFKTEADAEGAGFQAWDHKKRAAAKK